MSLISNHSFLSVSSDSTNTCISTPHATPNPNRMSNTTSSSNLFPEDMLFGWTEKQMPPTIQQLYTDIKRYSLFSEAILGHFPQPEMARRELQSIKTTYLRPRGSTLCGCKKDDPVLKEMDAVVVLMLTKNNDSPVMAPQRRPRRSISKGFSSIFASRSNSCTKHSWCDSPNLVFRNRYSCNQPQIDIASKELPPPPRPPRPLSLNLDQLNEVPGVVVLQRKLTKRGSLGASFKRSRNGFNSLACGAISLETIREDDAHIEQNNEQKASIFRVISQPVVQMASQAKRIFKENSKIPILQNGALSPLVASSQRANSEFWCTSI